MQSVEGVIWSVSMASSLRPGTLGSQNTSALPRMTGAAAGRSVGATVANDALALPGRRRAGWTVCTTLMLARTGRWGVGTGTSLEAVRPSALVASRRALASPDLSLLA